MKRRGECECGTPAGREKLFGVRVCHRCFCLHHSIRDFRPNVIETVPDPVPVVAPDRVMKIGTAGLVIEGYQKYLL